jgi:hypothetical protein
MQFFIGIGMWHCGREGNASKVLRHKQSRLTQKEFACMTGPRLVLHQFSFSNLMWMRSRSSYANVVRATMMAANIIRECDVVDDVLAR